MFLVLQSENGIYVQGAYHINGKFRSERTKNLSDDVCDGDEADDCTDTGSLDCDISSSDSKSKSEESSDASAHEVVLVNRINPTNGSQWISMPSIRRMHMKTLGHLRRQLLIFA